MTREDPQPQPQPTSGAASPGGARSASPRGTADRVELAAQQAMRLAQQAREHPEPSLGNRLGQIGILGWTIVVPALLGTFVGRLVDRHLHTGVFFTAPLLMLGAAFGLWSAWKWMHRQMQRK